MLFLISLFELFGNLVTQSLIIEACIVAEHTQDYDFPKKQKNAARIASSSTRKR
jgi:hypothetical protein